MEQLTNEIDKILKCGQCPSKFYQILSNLSIDNKQNEIFFYEDVLPKIYFLYGKILKKDLVYLALLAGDNYSLLEKFISYDKSIFVLNIEDPSSLFDYCLYNKQNWLCEVIDNRNVYERLHSNKTVYNKLSLAKLIQSSNQNIITGQIKYLLDQTDVEFIQNEFWLHYIGEVGKILETVLFVEKIVAVNESELFIYASKNSLLDTLSNYLDLNNKQNWSLIVEQFKQREEFDDLHKFQGFIILSTILNCTNSLQSSAEINENVRNKLLGLNDNCFQLTLLEDIFSIIFYRKNNKFACKETEVRLILFLLKSINDELMLKNNWDKSSEEFKRNQLLNKYLSDALWRLEVVTSVKSPQKTKNNLLEYMLAASESLIYLCLKTDNFERAYQIVKIFNLEESKIAKEIILTEKLQNQKIAIKNFLKQNDRDSIREHLLSTSKDVLFDWAITLPKTKEHNEIFIELCKNNSETKSDFSSNVFRLSHEAEIAVPVLLTSPYFPLQHDLYQKENEFFANLSILYDEFWSQITQSTAGSLDKNHPAHKTFLKLNNACGETNTPYLQRLYNYLQGFSRILFIEENSSDIVAQGRNISYFELLNYNRSELTGKLLFERQLNPTEFEKYFGKMKLDFLYHVVGNCFPTINLHIQENVTIDELYPDNNLYVPTKSIIIYILKRNWLLAFILIEMYKIKDIQMDISEIRLQGFFNYIKLPRIQLLKRLFDDNEIVAALQNCMSSQTVKSYIDQQVLTQDLLSIKSRGSSSSESLETGEELLEDAKITNWKALYEIIDSLPENQLRKKSELTQSRDNILVNLVQEEEYIKYVHFIRKRELRIDTILHHFKRWPGDFCIEIIKAEFSRFDAILDVKLRQLYDWIPKIELCEKLRLMFNMKSWYKCFDFCRKYTNEALIEVLQIDEISYAINFIEEFNPKEEVLCLINENYIAKVIENNTSLVKVKKLLDLLPFSHAIGLCNNLLTVLRSLDYLNFIAEYLENNLEDDDGTKCVKLGLKILTLFNQSEQDQLICLVNEPLNIVEVLIMNTKVDKLATVLDIIQSANDCEIFNNKVDYLLRKYAEKSLDFRIVTQLSSNLNKAEEFKLLQSLDSLNICGEKKQFLMPDVVPNKHDWIGNDEVLECMCCQQITFSMFSRRHHCRRCGRVVCYNCSQKRMLVPTYGDILVRVCSDCYEQTMGDRSSERSDVPSMRSLNNELWLLNDDPEHNRIVRDEFSYEHAPSVSLCLSILKFHSKSEEYSKFLLEQCDVMLKLLQQSQEPTSEIDYALVIRMLKSLAIAAKMSSLELGINSHSNTADRILSQANLLELLAERGSLNLITSNLLEPSALRRLIDKLLQQEQWHLALEVSTKAGLDNTGIFAAWGESCLKAGCLLLAREKFSRCFDKTAHYETQSNYSESSLGRSRFGSKFSNVSSACERDLPLLFDIVNILESKTIVLKDVPAMAKLSGSMLSLNNIPTSTCPALNIINKINNLKGVCRGEFNINADRQSNAMRPRIDSIFYDECIYYLSKYGSYLNLLEFMIKHGDFDAALRFIADNKLNADIFVDIYKKCLADGTFGTLQESMLKIEPSLIQWKDYLKPLCCNLEKQNLLNSLYQLQIFMGDYVRAAMTCIKFYEDSKSFIELESNVRFLYKAKEHLKQMIEQEQWVEVTSSLDKGSADDSSFEEKTIADPELIMKIDSRSMDKHISTIELQIEIVRNLVHCETAAAVKHLSLLRIPTLFGPTYLKNCLAVLLIVCAPAIKDYFDLALTLIKEYKLRPAKVYRLAGNYLAKMERYDGIQDLVNCIKSSEANDSSLDNILDEMLTLAVGTLIKANVTETKVEDLIKLIKDKATKISAYIEAKQLKTAYFLAVKYKRTADIRRIQREAELLNMPGIKALCVRKLQTSQSKE